MFHIFHNRGTLCHIINNKKKALSAIFPMTKEALCVTFSVTKEALYATLLTKEALCVTLSMTKEALLYLMHLRVLPIIMVRVQLVFHCIKQTTRHI